MRKQRFGGCGDLRLLCLAVKVLSISVLPELCGKRHIQEFRCLWLLVAPVFPGDVDPKSVNIQLDCFLATRSSKKEVLERRNKLPEL